MKLADRPISRVALTWLLILQLAVLLPVSLHLPVWLLAVALTCWFWRLAIYKGVISPPNTLARAGLVVICLGLVWLLEGHLVSLRGFAVLLALGFIFKLVELRHLRDGYAVLCVAVLLLTVNLLFSQSLVMSLLTAVSLFFLLCSWVGLNQSGSVFVWQHTLKIAGLLYLLALPLTLALFILVPRIPPLWQISTDSGQGQTGLSDSMSPGELSNLARSDALAFRVSFEGERPEQQELYWRTVVMTGFDGRRWWQQNDYWFKRKDFEIKGWARPLKEENSHWISWPEQPKEWHLNATSQAAYQIIMEPSQQHWLPALARPHSRTQDVGQVIDQRLIYRYPIQQRMQYQVASHTEVNLAFEAQQLKQHRQNYLAYPAAFNPQMQAYAHKLWQQTSSPTAFVQAFTAQIRRQNYVYTLEPPLLGEHAVDEFWFQTQRGFCAHYASALALALRVVGVPSRVIGGYQGGEWDEEAQFLQVRQYDAHAWVEYWHADKGWIRVDPTAAVAPHRIEQSFAQTLRAGQTQGAEAVLSWRLSNARWVSQIRRQWDQLEYLWHKRVLNYHQEQQLSLLKQWLGEVNWTALLIALMLAIVSFLALITLWQLKPWLQPKRAPEIKLYEALLKRLHQLGLRVSRHVPPSELEHHLHSLTDQQRYIVSQFVTCFLQLQYEQKPAHVGRKQWVLQQCHGMKQYLKQL